MRLINQRPFSPDDRTEAGHWEGDLIIGKDQRSAIGTLVEFRPASRPSVASTPARWRHAPRCARCSPWRSATHVAAIDHLGPGNRDVRHLTITEALGATVYFCDSRSPWQRGSNENTIGLLPDYFPTGTDPRVHSAEYLFVIENELNNRRRRVLGDRSPTALYDALLASPPHTVVQR